MAAWSGHFGSDGDFSEKALIQKSNTHLSNELGNLVQRTLSMTHKNCEGKIPMLSHAFSNEDQSLLIQAQNILGQAQEHMDNQELHKYVDALWSVIWAANKYVDEQAPWTLRKTDTERMNVVLYTLMETLRYIGIMAQPLIPDAAKGLLDMLSVPADQRMFSHMKSAFALEAAECKYHGFNKVNRIRLKNTLEDIVYKSNQKEMNR